jgi:hypothetical protein
MIRSVGCVDHKSFVQAMTMGTAIYEVRKKALNAGSGQTCQTSRMEHLQDTSRPSGFDPTWIGLISGGIWVVCYHMA